MERILFVVLGDLGIKILPVQVLLFLESRVQLVAVGRLVALNLFLQDLSVLLRSLDST